MRASGRKLIESLAQSDRRARRLGARASSPSQPMGAARGDRAGAGATRTASSPRRAGPTPVSAAGAARAWGGVQVRHAARRLAHASSRSAARRGLRADPADRRRAAAGTMPTGSGALRGLLDLLVGGVGLRRGRRHPERLAVGDVARLLARRGATSRIGGCGSGRDEGARARLAGVRGSGRRRRAGLDHPADRRLRSGRAPGPLYWYGIYPLHASVFQGMLQGIANRVTICDRS